MDNIKQQKLEKVLVLMKELLEVIYQEDEKNIDYIKRELRCAITLLEESTEKGTLLSNEIYEKVRNIYKSFFPPQGGLSDFFIWREDFEERVAINRKYSDLKKEIWSLFDLV